MDKKMKLNGMIHLHIKIGKIETGSTLYIAPDLDQTMILGEDWLKINKAQLCFNPNWLTIKGVEIPLGSKTSGQIKIYTVDSVKLPPRTAISCGGGNSREGRNSVSWINSKRKWEGENFSYVGKLGQ